MRIAMGHLLILHTRLFAQGHLTIFETSEELDALNSLIDAAPKWARYGDVLIGAISEGEFIKDKN